MMTQRDIAVHRIEAEISRIPTSLLPVNVAESACMAAFLCCEMSVITSTERDALVKRIRAAELIRYLELLKGAA